MQMDKLKHDKDYLNEQLNNISNRYLNASLQEMTNDLQSAQTLLEQKQKILIDEQLANQLLRSANERLIKENEQYKMIVDKSQQEVIRTKQQIDSIQYELVEMRQKYRELEDRFAKARQLNKSQSKLTLGLQTKVKELKDEQMTFNTNLSTIDSGTDMDFFNDASNKNLGSGHMAKRTIKIDFDPKLSKHFNLAKLNFMQMSDPQMSLEGSLSALSDGSEGSSSSFNLNQLYDNRNTVNTLETAFTRELKLTLLSRRRVVV